MPASRHLKLETVDFGNTEEVDAFLEQVMSEGIRRVRSESAELQAIGLMDADEIFSRRNFRPTCAKALSVISAGRCFPEKCSSSPGRPALGRALFSLCGALLIASSTPMIAQRN
jgi:hypothetical protein